MSTNICWMCGAKANSSEHRLKKADIVRAYGRGPYIGPDRPLHVRAGILTEIQGPKSRTIKYEAILCEACNTTKSQPYDKAYDKLIEYVLFNEAEIISKCLINFADVYGADFATLQLHLYKYLAKSFGCRLLEANQVVPADVSKLFDKEQFQTALRITFSVNEDILAMPHSIRNGFIGKSDLTAMVERTDNTKINGFYFSEHVSWFTINYWYRLNPDSNMGSTWIADRQHVYLGSHAPLTQEQRTEMLAIISEKDA